MDLLHWDCTLADLFIFCPVFPPGEIVSEAQNGQWQLEVGCLPKIYVWCEFRMTVLMQQILSKVSVRRQSLAKKVRCSAHVSLWGKLIFVWVGEFRDCYKVSTWCQSICVVAVLNLGKVMGHPSYILILWTWCSSKSWSSWRPGMSLYVMVQSLLPALDFLFGICPFRTVSVR